MAYSKVPLPCADYAFGIQDFNALAANTDAIVDFLDVRHGVGRARNRWELLGHHDDDLVPRSVARFELRTILGGDVMVQQIGGPAVGSIRRQAVGDYVVTVRDLTEYQMLVQPEVTAITQLRWARVEYVAASAVTPAAFRVLLYAQAAEADPFELADYSFCFALLGTTT